jgi:hypothetical protein
MPGSLLSFILDPDVSAALPPPTPRGWRTMGLEGHLPEGQPLKAAATGDPVRV